MDRQEICCWRCDHDFMAQELVDGMCPRCGLHYSWEYGVGHDNVEFITPDWEDFEDQNGRSE